LPKNFTNQRSRLSAVPQDQVGFLRLHDVLRRRLVTVDLGAGLGDGLHDRGVTRDVLRHVLDDGEGRHDALFLSGDCAHGQQAEAEEMKKKAGIFHGADQKRREMPAKGW
jgi:hypothetical protein